jgi:phenylalanyl-tRNA synthetase beta subunit
MARVQTVESGVRDAYKIRKSNISYLELPLEAIPTTKIGDIPPVTIPSIDIITYAPLGKYQASHRDIAFIVSSTHPLESIAQAIADFHPLVVAAELFDTYTDPKLGKNVTSYAFHIVYQSPDKTLTSDEINQLHAKLERHIKEKFNAIIR